MTVGLPAGLSELGFRCRVGSLLKYPTVPRCCRFFVFPRREECAYPSRSRGIMDEQRRKGEKAVQPGGLERLGLSGYVIRSSSRHRGTDMLVAYPLLSTPKRSSAARPGILTGSLILGLGASLRHLG